MSKTYLAERVTAPGLMTSAGCSLTMPMSRSNAVTVTPRLGRVDEHVGEDGHRRLALDDALRAVEGLLQLVGGDAEFHRKVSLQVAAHGADQRGRM